MSDKLTAIFGELILADVFFKIAENWFLPSGRMQKSLERSRVIPWSAHGSN